MVVVYSKEQKIVFDCKTNENTLLLAGPGAGKTFTITEWLIQMIKRGDIQPSEVLLATFTRNAGYEMRMRLRALMPDNKKIEKLACDTFHALACIILMRFKLLSLKNDLYHVSQILSQFLRFLRDDNNPDSLAFRKQIKIVFLDEYQDVNKVQVEIAYEFYRAGARIVAVGDNNQEIYGFRGSDNRWFREFPNMFTPCRVCYLSTNYRSTQAIVDVSNAVISHNIKMIEKPDSVSSTRHLEHGPLPVILNHQNSFEGYKDVAKRINTLLKSNTTIITATSPSNPYTIQPHDIVVQSRNSKPLFQMQTELIALSIPCILLSDKSASNNRTKEQTHQLTQGKVVLSTVHGVKGLEYLYVFIIGLHRNFFPSQRELNLEAERRLFFVAVTRAKRFLYLSNCYPESSIFIYEIPLNLVRTGVRDFPRKLPDYKSLPCHCSLLPEDYKKQKSNKKIKLEEEDEEEKEEEEEDEEEDDYDSDSQAEETDKEDSDAEFSSGDDEEQKEAKLAVRRQRKTISVDVNDIIRLLEGDQYDYMKEFLLPKPLPWQLVQTELAPKINGSEEEKKKEEKKDNFNFIKNEENHEFDFDLREDYDQLGMQLPFEHTNFIRQNMLEADFSTFLNCLSLRMLQEIMFRNQYPLGSSMPSLINNTQGNMLPLSNYYIHLEAKACMEKTGGSKTVKGQGIPPQFQSFMMRHYQRFQDAHVSWHQILVSIFWTAACKSIREGKQAILYHNITENELQPYMNMFREMYHQLYLFTQGQGNLSFCKEVGLDMPFSSLMKTDQMHKGKTKEQATKICNRVRGLEHKKIILKGNVMALSSTRLLYCCHQPVAAFNMEDLLEQDILNNSQNSFPIEPVMESLTISAILACQDNFNINNSSFSSCSSSKIINKTNQSSKLFKKEQKQKEEKDEEKENQQQEKIVPNEIIIYNSFARQWCLVNLVNWARQMDWLEYLCLYYCYHKETTRKQALELQKQNIALA